MIKSWLLFSVLIFSTTVFCAERTKFEWEATSIKNGRVYKGEGKKYLVQVGYLEAQLELDALARGGKIDDKEDFKVRIHWKEKDFERTLTSHSQYPVELPRGPDKTKELPRGPIPQWR